MLSVFFIMLFKRFFIAYIGMMLGLVSFVAGPTLNHSFVKKNGVLGTGVITSMKDSSVAVNRVRQKDFTALLKTQEGDTIEVSFDSAQGVFERPYKGEASLLPDIGEQFAILYIPRHVKNFIIPEKNPSPFGLRVTCMSMEKNIESAQATYQYSSSDASLKQKYKNLLEKFVQSDCAPARRQAQEAILKSLQ